MTEIIYTRHRKNIKKIFQHYHIFCSVHEQTTNLLLDVQVTCCFPHASFQPWLWRDMWVCIYIFIHNLCLLCNFLGVFANLYECHYKFVVYLITGIYWMKFISSNHNKFYIKRLAITKYQSIFISKLFRESFYNSECRIFSDNHNNSSF